LGILKPYEVALLEVPLYVLFDMINVFMHKLSPEAF